MKASSITSIFFMLLFLSCSDQQTEQTTGLLSSYNAFDTFVALSSQDSGEGSNQLFISIPNENFTVQHCPDSGSACGTKATSTDVFKKSDNRVFLRSRESIKLSNNLIIRVELLEQGVLKGSFTVKTIDASIKPDESEYLWDKHISLVDVNEQQYSGNTYGSAIFRDTMTHVKTPYLNDGPLTSVHESMHFLLHENDSKTMSGNKFIYATNGKGSFWPEPVLKTASIEPYIPRDVVRQAKLYNTYIKSRPTQVLGENIFDEWLAYITESYFLIESHKTGTPIPNDSVEGCSTEFLYYGAAAMQALYEKEPEHLNKQNVKAIFAMLAERSRWIVDNIQTTSGLESTRTTSLFQHLQSDPSSESIRVALKKIYGQAWTRRVLGF